MKEIIKKRFIRSEFAEKVLLRLYNKVSGGQVIFRGTQIRHNIARLDRECLITCGNGCDIQHNEIRVTGENNEIYLGNNVRFWGEGEKKASVLVWGKNNRIIIEDNCKLVNVQFFIRGDNNIIHLHSACSAVYCCFHIEQDSVSKQNKIEILSNTSIHGRQEREVEFFLDEGTMLHVGEDCMFSSNIQVRTTDSHSVLNLQGERINLPKNVWIGSHCWIGMNTMILKGSRIADHTIVAAGSICTKEFIHPGTVIAGNPARIVKKQCDWKRKQL